MTASRRAFPLLLASMALLAGCGFLGFGSSSPAPATITLTVTDCAKDNIKIEKVSSFVRAVGGNQYSVGITVKVTCSGQPVANAEIKITPWIGDAIKFTTDAKGTAQYTRRTQADPRPVNITVDVEGSDGTKAQKLPL